MSADDVRSAASDVLDDAAATDLLSIARAMFPHDGLGDAPYIRTVDALVARTATEPVLLRVITNGLRELRTASGDKLAVLDGEALRVLLAERETGAFFVAVRAFVAFAFYDDREVWEYVGYPGPSFELGGYLHRGFDDLAWLPDPRIEESDLPFDEIGPLRAVERNV